MVESTSTWTSNEHFIIKKDSSGNSVASSQWTNNGLSANDQSVLIRDGKLSVNRGVSRAGTDNNINMSALPTDMDRSFIVKQGSVRDSS